MDYSDRPHLQRFVSSLSQRIQALPRSLEKRFRLPSGSAQRRWPRGWNQKTARRWKGILFIISALVAGFWANQAAKSEALMQWERNHLPSERIFTYAILAQGLGRAPHSNIHGAMRSLPVSVDEEGAVWLSEEANWVVFFRESESTLPAFLYCRDCQMPPQKWEPLGKGWSGMELAIESLERKRAELLEQAEKRRKRQASKAVDPREIRY